MFQWMKVFTQHSCKCQTWWCVPLTPALKQEDTESLLASHSRQTSELPLQWDTLSQGTEAKRYRKWHLLYCYGLWMYMCMHMCVHACVCACVCVCVHAHTHKENLRLTTLFIACQCFKDKTSLFSYFCDWWWNTTSLCFCNVYNVTFFLEWLRIFCYFFSISRHLSLSISVCEEGVFSSENVFFFMFSELLGCTF